tara:strand:- start:1733 stop:3655 length:1923 start_codon:yes stop_codon:yes gene_type:complete
MNSNKTHWVKTPWGNGPYFSVSLEGFNTNEKNLNISTANEDGQNRQDEQNDKSKPVIVKISEKIIKNENFYNKFLSGMQENLEINPKNKIYQINKKNIRLIIIECFNTNGLTGSFTEEDNDNYERFFIGSTKSKTGGKLGRRQLGRHVYMLASKLRGFLALSIEKNQKKEFLRGSQFLDKYSFEGEKMNPYSFFGYSKKNTEKQNEKETLPILDKDIIDEFKQLTGIKRDSNDFGLSVVIPEPQDGITSEKIFKNYIKRFFPSLLMGNLIIKYKDNDVSNKNIKDILINEKMTTEKWLSFFDEVYKKPDKNINFISNLSNYNYQTSINLDEIDEDKIKKIKEDYYEKKPVVLKLFVKIPFLKHYQNKIGERNGYFKLALQKLDSSDTPIKPIFLRGSLQIPNEAKYFKFHKSAYAALWIENEEDNNLFELMGDSEGMAHDSWNMNHPEVSDSYGEEVKKVFLYVKSSLGKIFSFITDKKDQFDLETFSDDLPTFEDIQEKERVIQKEVLFDNPEPPIVDPPPPPPPGQRKMVKEIKINGGFKIIKTEECENDNFPMKVRVRFAYRARNKNSFRCYNPKLHFDLTQEKGVKISNKKNIDSIQTIGNGLDFLATDPDFEIDITGFEELEKKDLDVRARKLKG